MSKLNLSPALFTSTAALLLTFAGPLAAQPTPESPPGSEGPAASPPVTPAPIELLSLEEELASFVRPGALTASQVAARAVEDSPRIEAKRAAVHTADALADETLARFYPQLTGRAQYTRLSRITPPSFGSSAGTSTVYLPGDTPFPRPYDPTTDQLMVVSPPTISFPLILDNYSLVATLTIPVSDYVFRLSSALSGATKAKDAAELNERAEKLLVQTDAKIAYYGWVKALGGRYVAEKGHAQVEASLRDVQQAFSMGTASKADVLRVESQLKNFELLKARAEQAVRVTSEQLRTVMHEKERQEYFVGESILVDIDRPVVASLDEAIEEARNKRLELKAIASMEGAYKDQASLAKVGYLPRLDAQGNVTYANPNQRFFGLDQTWRATWDVSLILTWTPTDIPRASAEAAGANAKATEASAQRRQIEDGLRMEVAAALADFENAVTSVETSREVLKSSEEGFRVRSELFKAGRATALEVTEAQQSLTQARLDLVFAHVDARITKEKLLHALGRNVEPESKSK